MHSVLYRFSLGVALGAALSGSLCNADPLTDPTRPPSHRVVSETTESIPTSMKITPVAADASDTDNQLRFDVDVSNAPARSFFQTLVNGTRTNMLVHPDVSGRVSLTLKHVTVDEVLDAARDLYGYDYRKTQRGFMVLPANIQSRVFQLNYLDLQRYGVSKTRISSGQITQSGNANYGNNASSTATSEQGSSQDNGKPTVDISGTSVLTRVDSDFWSGIEADLHAIVGDKPDRGVVINRQSGVIVVKAMPTELRDVADYLNKTSETVTRQVVLEAKIVEVELNDAYQAGINWAGVLKNGGEQYFLGQRAPPSGFDVDPLTPRGSPVTVAPGNPISGFVQNTLGGAFTVAANFGDFNAFIELLGAQGRTRVLSSPRVSTLHNQKAIIKAGEDEFFVTSVSSNTVTGTSTSTSRDVQLTPFFSGVALDVTPQIGDKGSVILHIHPAISEVNDQTKTLTVDGTTDTLPLALSRIRESDSIVRAMSGQVIVIGGLMREQRNKQSYKTPVLGDIPGLGRLFRSERDTSKTTELVILLRPLVVNDADWPSLVQEPNDRVEKLVKQGKLE
jgi:MSHA biogenesis protein MshL